MIRRSLGLALIFSLASLAHADFNDGVAAHAMGDYEHALQILMPLAETSDHAYAQYYLGVMYANGQGVERNFEEAARWFRAAAEKGVASAQAKLANLYETGRGVPRDMEFAYAWYAVADALGNTRASQRMKKPLQNMSSDEQEHAMELAEEFIAKYGKTDRKVSRSQ